MSESTATDAPPLRLLFEAPPGSERVVVVVDEAPKKLGEIYLPDKIKDRPCSGVVVAVGPKAPEWVGRRLVFGESTGVRCKIEGEPYLILTPDDVLHLVPTGTPAPFSEELASASS